MYVGHVCRRAQAGHQEWTRTGEEPKVPVDPPKSVVGSAGNYVTSAVSWVAGSLLGKSEAAASEKDVKKDKNGVWASLG